MARQLVCRNYQAAPKPLRHIGIYAYRVGFLKQFPELPQAEIEVCEALEQLRALWHGYRIAVHVTAQAPGPGVDTPEDLQRVRAFFQSAKPYNPARTWCMIRHFVS